MRVLGIAVSLALILPLAACFHQGELGKLGFQLEIADALYEFASGDRVLLGTHMCPSLGFVYFGEGESNFIDPDNEHCFTDMLSGPAQFDAQHCWTLDSPGEVIWEVVLTNEDGCDPGYAGDRMVVEVTAPGNELRLGFDDWRVRAPTVNNQVGWPIPLQVIGLAPGRTLADLREDPNAARLVIAGELDTPMLRLDDDLGRLYFADADVTFEFVGAGATAIEPEPPVDPEIYPDEYRFPGERPLMLDPAAVVRIRANLPGGLMLESPELIAVAASAAESLDLMVMLDGEGKPSFAFAEARDGQGRVLHAAPIEWDMAEGALAVVPGDLGGDGRTREYAALASVCEPPSTTEALERHAILRARLGALEDTVELTWIDEVEDPDIFDEPFVPDQACLFADDFPGNTSDTGDTGETDSGDELGGDDGPTVDDGGCACAADSERSNSPLAAAWLALTLLFVRRRRRG